MIKTISKIGNSQGLIFDAALMDLTHLKVGDPVDITVHDGGTIVLTPTRPVITPEEGALAAEKIISQNKELFRRLAK